MQKKKLTIILEKADDGSGFWARVDEDAGNYLPATFGETIPEVTNNMYELVEDYLENEGKTDPAWAGITSAKEITFEYTYDLQAFFEGFPALKITEIAAEAGLNGSLVRQYATGKKHASETQVKKIETAIHQLGKALLDVHLV